MIMCESLINALVMATRCFHPLTFGMLVSEPMYSIPNIFNFSIALRSTSSSEYLLNFKPGNMMFCKTVNSSNSLVSSTKTFKKRRNISLLTGFALLNFHSALAVTKRCQCLFADAKIYSSSFSLSIFSLQPRPDFTSKPEIPSNLYRFNQLLTLILLIPTILPTSFEGWPSDFKSIVWQRFRKLWLLLFLNSISKKLRSWLEEAMERSVDGYTSKN